MGVMRIAPLLVALLLPAVSASGAGLELLSQLPADPPPPELVRGSHYYVSNETRLDLFHAAVRDKGGVYVGVGSDQNYLLAGWARAEALVLVDFDQAVVSLHRVYRVLFRAAETPEDFLRLWSPRSYREVRRLVEESYPRGPERSSALSAYGHARWSVDRRLRKVLPQMKQASLPCFLTDAGQYAHLRKLYLEDRVFAVRGDLTASRTLSALGKALEESGQVVRVLYLSNAEQYFPYGAQYRSNIRGLPMDEGSVVLRTSGQRGIPHVRGTYYHYNTQSGRSFAAWLEDEKTRQVRPMLKLAAATEVYGLSRLEVGPEEARAAAQAAARERLEQRAQAVKRGKRRRAVQ
jgi:hypothetical protein